MKTLTPPMGWNTWNTFGTNFNEETIMQTADAFVSLGLKDAGYKYVIMDDGAIAGNRDENGRLMPDETKFPHGIRYVSDYIHSKGLKFGMYSSSGYRTCMGLPGGFGHEFCDAARYAEWDIDYLKYDYCHRPSHIDSETNYHTMGLALQNCGKEILFSACSWGKAGTERWIKSTGAGAWRSTGDISDNWASIKDIAMQQVDLQPFNAQGCFNDMDMLVVGMHGKGNVGLGGCTDDEYITHFALWCMLSSPLIIGGDIRSMDEKSLDLLKHKGLIAINQDAGGYQPYRLKGFEKYAYPESKSQAWGRLMANGDTVLGFFNLDDNDMGFTKDLRELGLGQVADKVTATDVITGESFAMLDGTYITPALKAHACKIIRLHINK